MTRVDSEFCVSKEIIDKKIGQKTIFLALPYGRTNKNVLRISESLGYRAAVSAEKGRNPFFSNPLTLKKIHELEEELSLAKKQDVDTENCPKLLRNGN